MDLEKIQQLMKTLEESKLKKLVIKQGEFELTLEKEGEMTFASMPSMMPHPHVVRGALEEASQEVSQRKERGGAPRIEIEGVYVSSPMVGTFYASSGPDLPPFVKIGDIVEESTVVCIIEAMKVLNEVKAGKTGRVVEILVQNTQPIEFGSKLFRIV